MAFTLRPFRRFPCSVLRPTTQAHSKGRAPSGISLVQVGDSLAIFRYELERSAH